MAMTVAEHAGGGMTRAQQLEEIRKLPSDMARLEAYLKLTIPERYELGILMCGCADWMHCEHPYPMRISDK